MIVLGPGSLYTSVIPNLIIRGMSEAIGRTNAFKIYVCNVMTQEGETDNYSASDHLKAIVDHTNRDVINACIINTSSVPSAELLERYRRENSYPVQPDIEKIKAMGYKAVATDILSVTDYVRHDSKKLMAALIKLIETHRVIKR